MGKLVIKYGTKLKPNQFFDEIKDKISVFLHHTVGSSWEEAVTWWNQTSERVGTALGIERDGRVLQCYEINRWAYHLGVTTGTGKTTRESVGIELISWGYLFKEKDGKGEDVFVAYPLFPLKQRRVIVPKDQVCELEKEWRGHKYWHKYTDAQIESTILLLRYLVDRFKIKVQTNLKNFWEYNEEVIKKDLPGIHAHSTVRKDKTDIFPQPELIEAIYKEFGTKP